MGTPTPSPSPGGAGGSGSAGGSIPTDEQEAKKMVVSTGVSMALNSVGIPPPASGMVGDMVADKFVKDDKKESSVLENIEVPSGNSSASNSDSENHFISMAKTIAGGMEDSEKAGNGLSDGLSKQAASKPKPQPSQKQAPDVDPGVKASSSNKMSPKPR